VESSAGQFAWREVGPARPLFWHTNHGRDVADADASVGGTSLARAAVIRALAVPASEPDVAWFADVLAGAPPPAGVRADTTDVGRKRT
jgi:hypothetical protein